MKILILEDDFFCRVLLQKLLLPYGECHVAVQGREAVTAFEMALDAGQPYALVCLDILVPELNGHEALKAMRAAENARGIFSGQGAKIVMATVMDDMKTVMAAYSELCDGYLPKPISRESLARTLHELHLV